MADLGRVGMVSLVGAMAVSGREDAAWISFALLIPMLGARVLRLSGRQDAEFTLLVLLCGALSAAGWLAESERDTVAHLLVAVTAVPLASRGLHALRRGRPIEHVTWPPVFVLLVVAALAWEGLEAAADGVFGTDFSLGVRDTAVDLMAACVGAAFGILVARKRSSATSIH